ncbi:MAG: hypothetical protein JW715_08845 [Sedimentisphaerales bacterium]|nr:hypothetical protein [Sedimentisphaerales bacterium]
MNDSDDKLFAFLVTLLFGIERRLSKLLMPERGTRPLEIIRRLFVVFGEFMPAELLCLGTRYLLTGELFVLFEICGVFLVCPNVCREGMLWRDGRDITCD